MASANAAKLAVLPALLPLLALLCLGSLARADTVTYTGTTSDNDWSDSQNWTPPPYPDTSGDNVVINSVPVTLDVPVTIGSLTLSNGAEVEMLHDTTLNVTGNLTDNGSIIVNSDQGSAAAALNFNGGTVSGTGAIILDTAGYSEVTGTLTQAAGHTISGAGEIAGGLTNYGVVNANDVSGQTLTIEIDNVVNNGVIEASGGGELDIDGITVTQGTNAELLASGGLVVFDGETKVNGGAINCSNNSAFLINSGVSTFNSVSIGGYLSLGANTGAVFNSLNALNGEVDMAGGSTLNVTGNLIDNGLIFVNSDGVAASSVLNFNGVTVSGTGTILLYMAGDAEVSGTLTQGSGHSIIGTGEIAAKLTNNGVVNADDYNGPTLAVQTFNIVNNGIMEASSGGLLDIIGITVTQGTNGQLLANGGNVQFDGNTTVSGGALNGSTSVGYFEVNSGTATFNSASINRYMILSESTGAVFNSLTALNGQVFMEGGDTLNVTGNLIDNGGIVVNGYAVNLPTEVNFNGVAVSGTGDLNLYYAGYSEVTGTLTQGSGHTIDGTGEIAAKLTNNGVVDADGVFGGNGPSFTLSIQTFNIVNNQVIEATDSNGAVTLPGAAGLLDIIGIAVTQGTNGRLFANGGNVQFDGNTTVSGGALDSTGTSVFAINTGVAAFNSVTNNATVDMASGTRLIVGGGLINNGTVNMAEGTTVKIVGNLTGNGSVFGLGGDNAIGFGGGTVSGTGSIVLYGTVLSGTLIQAAGHTISGYGTIAAALTNAGLVDAAAAGRSLVLSTDNLVNNGIMECTGGVLDINGITVTQGQAASSWPASGMCNWIPVRPSQAARSTPRAPAAPSSYRPGWRHSNP